MVVWLEFFGFGGVSWLVVVVVGMAGFCSLVNSRGVGVSNLLEGLGGFDFLDCGAWAVL